MATLTLYGSTIDSIHSLLMIRKVAFGFAGAGKRKTSSIGLARSVETWKQVSTRSCRLAGEAASGAKGWNRPKLGIERKSALAPGKIAAGERTPPLDTELT